MGTIERKDDLRWTCAGIENSKKCKRDRFSFCSSVICFTIQCTTRPNDEREQSRTNEREPSASRQRPGDQGETLTPGDQGESPHARRLSAKHNE
ncbi:hypothetical protein CYMTET_22103 [Cymbomonas tetramitiformis]|uniref:Uncharacterized protein n=1 Tax=Cymbomonas tetramitiformis TaxID=36881 RepID=A0AAE0G0K1_9CHLO|nr:hypothetical protein CYMTET_22103 [Cymbomonas tetramitiformis]